MSRRNGDSGNGLWLVIFIVIMIRLISVSHSRSSYTDREYARTMTEARAANSDLTFGGGYRPCSTCTSDPVVPGPDWNATSTNRRRIEDLIAVMKRGETESMLAYEHRQAGGVRIVFLDGSARVTIDWDGKEKLTFWSRKNGTSGNNTLVKFTDVGLMGAPNHGEWFVAEDALKDEMYFDRDSGQYLGNAGYWQEYEDGTLAAAEDIL